MNLKKTSPILFFLTLFITSVFAEINKGLQTQSQSTESKMQAGCAQGLAQATLDINNVRTTILAAGEMWWDTNFNPRYEIPKGSGLHSMYAGALWIGGTDAGGNIKIAAQTYRQTGPDFWPGAVEISTPTILPSRCSHYDKHWKISKADVLNFINNGVATPDMISYPGNGDVAFGEDPFLAPFFDTNADGIYDVASGDYPNYNFSSSSPGGSNCNNYLFGDQTI